jgi:hypothetical protein
MRQNEQHLYEGSRWVLYHGTTTSQGAEKMLISGGLASAMIGIAMTGGFCGRPNERQQSNSARLIWVSAH